MVNAKALTVMSCRTCRRRDAADHAGPGRTGQADSALGTVNRNCSCALSALQPRQTRLRYTSGIYDIIYVTMPNLSMVLGGYVHVCCFFVSPEWRLVVIPSVV